MGHGLLGYDDRQLGRMTMRRLANAIKGYEERIREGWEQTRLIAYYACIPHLKNGRSLKPADLIPLTWDDEKKTRTPREINKQEVYKILEKWSK